LGKFEEFTEALNGSCGYLSIIVRGCAKYRDLSPRADQLLPKLKAEANNSSANYGQLAIFCWNRVQ
jgi:hypothetical protein